MLMRGGAETAQLYESPSRATQLAARQKYLRIAKSSVHGYAYLLQVGVSVPKSAAAAAAGPSTVCSSSLCAWCEPKATIGSPGGCRSATFLTLSFRRILRFL